MKVVIRTDASLQIGTGHVMRCLTLANGIREVGGIVEFICRADEGHLATVIKDDGFRIHLLENIEVEHNQGDLFHAKWLSVSQNKDAEQCCPILTEIKPDWLIVDHYAIDKTWQSALKGTYEKLMVIDDLGDREQYCDLLLDQNYGSDVEKYRDLVPKYCNVLTGTNYALLRPEFSQWRGISLEQRTTSKLNTILVTLGGVDPDNYTCRILEAISNAKLSKDINITVIMGATAPYILAVKQQALAMPYKTEVKVNVSNMAELMANSDLAIGAAGATTWERCCLGLPSVQIVIAKNQQAIADSLDEINAINLVSSMSGLKEQLESHQSWMNNTSQITRELCDGLGSKRVVKIMEGALLT